MLEARSPLGAAARFEGEGLVLQEAPDFTLAQVAGNEKALKAALGKLPSKVGVAIVQDGATLMRVGPDQIWVLGKMPEPVGGVHVTPLSSARTRILLEGPRSRELLASIALIDFSPSHFKEGQFVMTAIHHTPVTIHVIGPGSFYIYTLRTFALNTWEWLCDATHGLRPAT
jgi:methylglutamate dehydrogenase subunit D